MGSEIFRKRLTKEFYCETKETLQREGERKFFFVVQKETEKKKLKKFSQEKIE